jgi:hypothetical protein
MKEDFGILREHMRLLEDIEYCNGRYGQVPATPR